jgi:hypothetical protein
MNMEALTAEASRLSQLATVELIGELGLVKDQLPLSVRATLPLCAEFVAKRKLMLIAGIDPNTVMLYADYRAAVAVLSDVEVFGKIKLDHLLESTIDSLIVKALSLAGTALRGLLLGR